MSKDELKSILQDYKGKIALIIGNGINRYRSNDDSNSWEALLRKLAEEHLKNWNSEIIKGISFPELYDILELQTNLQNPSKNLPQEIINFLKGWSPQYQHYRICDWAKQYNAPILTTNYDLTLSIAGNLGLHHHKGYPFTSYYPWGSYYSHELVDNPSKSFGIWHVNGMITYWNSMRLGLAHYMGSVERVRSWLHKGKDKRLFSGKNPKDWKGANSWLHVVFNNPLLIFGIGLNQNEVFLRWLLIERARYFHKFPNRELPAWYVNTEDLTGTGKGMFFKGVGIKVVQVKSYDDIYGEGIWDIN